MSQTISVKVMRSHDYCHFEIALSASSDTDVSLEKLIACADSMRKDAARLADRAVSQYRIAKSNAARLLAEKAERGYETDAMNKIRATPDTQRTVGDQAKLKAFDDAKWEASRAYDYEDQWEADDEF